MHSHTANIRQKGTARQTKTRKSLAEGAKNGPNGGEGRYGKNLLKQKKAPTFDRDLKKMLLKQTTESSGTQ